MPASGGEGCLQRVELHALRRRDSLKMKPETSVMLDNFALICFLALQGHHVVQVKKW